MNGRRGALPASVGKDVIVPISRVVATDGRSPRPNVHPGDAVLAAIRGIRRAGIMSHTPLRPAAFGFRRGGFFDSKADLGERGEDEAGELQAEAAVKLGLVDDDQEDDSECDHHEPHGTRLRLSGKRGTKGFAAIRRLSRGMPLPLG
jgi:hypothetical protein